MKEQIYWQRDEATEMVKPLLAATWKDSPAW